MSCFLLFILWECEGRDDGTLSYEETKGVKSKEDLLLSKESVSEIVVPLTGLW